jgi:preprotein translocase subunit YajC
MLAVLMLLAQQAPEGGGGAPSYFAFLWMAPVLVLLYFMILRPSQRQEAQRRTLLAALKKGDKVENQGGIIGWVESIKDKDNEVVLRGGVRVTKASIVRIIPPEEPAKDQKEGGA